MSGHVTEKKMFTHHGQIVGTFEYMSPDQAGLNQWHIDARTSARHGHHQEHHEHNDQHRRGGLFSHCSAS
jgi:hypothetical protein